MARLPYLNPEDLPPKDRDALTRPILLNRLLAHSPDAQRKLAAFGGWIRNETRLDPRLRELAIIQVGYVTSTVYEYTHHVEIGRQFGVTDNDIAAIAIESAGGASGLPDLDRVVLRCARTMTTESRLSDEDFRLLEERLGREHLVDLIVTIAFYNLVVRVLNAFEIDTEPEYLRVLDRFPLPPEPRP